MIIETHDLHKSFGRHAALRGVSLAIPEGSAFALVGANGAGKTTTIKVLMNIIGASRGTATVLDMDSRRLSPRELAQIGYVSENQVMPGRLTVRQYIDYLRPFYASWDRGLEREILDELRLPGERRIGALSHGMRIKLALACALPFRPRLLVLDEPFSGLDSLIREEFMERLLRQAGDMTILISSHELAEIEGVVTHVGFLDEGKLLFQESMEDLSGRVREVRVTLEHEPALPARVPQEWLGIAVAGSVVSFVDTRFRADHLAGSIASLFAGVKGVDVQPVALRSIFMTLARAERNRRI
ncbi:MAG: ABC transporter ATP-binding protein [Steroidobacteraceae bacterium]